MAKIQISNFPKKLHDEIRIDVIKNSKSMSEWWIEAASLKLGKQYSAITNKTSASDALGILVEDIANAYLAGRPFTSSGKNGIYNRRHELNEKINSFGKDKLYNMAVELLKSGKVIKKTGKGSSTLQWLDVPTASNR